MPQAQQPGLNPDGSYNSVPRPRPRFDLAAPAPPPALLAHFEQVLRSTPDIRGLVIPENQTVELMLADSRIRFWSPQLSLLLIGSTSGSLIKARFGPHPHVWGMFLAGYALTGMLASGLALFGCVQLFLEQTPWALYAMPVALLGTALVYGAAYVGQGLGAGQMHDLRTFLDKALDSAPEC